jgi:hypothetical protein
MDHQIDLARQRKLSDVVLYLGVYGLVDFRAPRRLFIRQLLFALTGFVSAL